MAQDDLQSNIGLADEVAGSSSANSTVPSSGPAEQKFTPTPGKPLLIQFNQPIRGIGAIISQVSVNNIPILESQAKLRAGDFITVVGVGLEVFDPQEWKLQRQGKAPVTMPVMDVAKNGKWVTLRVPVGAVSGLQENESLGLSFFSSQIGGRLRMLPIVLVYEPQDQTAPPKTAVSEVSPKIEAVKEPVVKPPQPKARSAEQIALGVIVEFINQTPEVFKDIRVREQILKALSLGSWQKISPADQKSLLEGLAQVSLLNKLPESVKTAIEGMAKVPLASVKLAQKPVSAVQSQKKPDQAEANEANDDDETGQEVLSNQAGEEKTQVDLQSSGELVNKYIAENPLAISDIQTKQNIQTALKTGDLSSLNGTEHIVLQAVANNIGLKSTGPLKTASQVVRNASVQQVANKQPASASVKVSQTVSGQNGEVNISQTQNTQNTVNVQSPTDTGESTSEAKISQTSEATISVDQTQRAEETPTTTVASGGESEESIKINNPVTNGSDSNLSPTELKILVEYLKANNLIPEAPGVRSQFLATLANPEGKNLSDADQQKLLEVLKQVSLESTAPKRVKDSANQVLKQITAQKNQSGVNPIQPQPNQSTIGVDSKPRGKVKPKADAQAKLAQMRKREAQLLAKGSLSSLSGKIIQPVSQEERLDATASVKSKVSVVKKDTSQALSSETAPVAMSSAGIMPKSSTLGENTADDLPSGDSNLSTSTLPTTSDNEPSDLPKDPTKSIPPVPSPLTPSAETDEKNNKATDQLSPLERAELEKQQQAEANLQKAKEILVSRQGVKSFNVKEAETIINKEIDLVLNRLAFSVWAGAIPSFGLSILLGAILGDLLWLLGPKFLTSSGKIAGWLMNKLPMKSPLTKSADIIAKIEPKISLKVKLQILLMNAIILIVGFFIIVVIIVVLYDICSSKLNYLSADAYNLNEYCASIKTLVEGAGQ